MPDAPPASRRELELLEEVDGALGFALWRAASDVLLWTRAPADGRAGLLSAGTPVEVVEEAAALAPAVAEALRLLLAIPPTAEPAAVAEACARICAWAEEDERKRVAVHFAELAAWVEPESSKLAAAAGRLCRRMAEFERAKLWVQRALRLARRAGNEIDFADAHRLMGFALMDQGRFAEAEPHFWKCVRVGLRTGRTSLAGAGYHNLLVVSVHLERFEEAWQHAAKAVRYYTAGYPSLPELAHDVGYFWCRCGFYSSAIPLFEACLPLLRRGTEQVLVHASMARSAAMVRDNFRFQRMAAVAIDLAERDFDHAAAALYHVAEGARCFEEWERAEQLAREAQRRAVARRNPTITRWSEALLENIRQRVPVERDIVPPAGGPVDVALDTLLRKLRRHARVAPGPRHPVEMDEVRAREEPPLP